MDIYTGDNGVAGMAHRTWTLHAAAAAPRKRRANAAPTLASVDRSFI
jgi:hypothetical protein